MKEVRLRRTINSRVSSVCTLLNGSFEKRYHSSIQHLELTISPWKKIVHPETKQKSCQRVLTYLTSSQCLGPTKPNGTAHIKVKEIQSYWFENGTLVISSKNYFEGYSIYFSITRKVSPDPIDLEETKEIKKNCCTCDILIQIQYKGDLRKEAIVSSMERHILTSVETWLQLANEQVSEKGEFTNDTINEHPNNSKLELEYKSSIDSLHSEIHQIRSTLEENKTRFNQNTQILETGKNFRLEQIKETEETVLHYLEETLNHSKILKTLVQQQAELSEKLRRNQIWKIRIEEVDRKLKWISVQLRFPFVVFSSRNFFLVILVFLVVWPVVIRNMWTIFVSSWLRKLVKFLDYFYNDKDRWRRRGRKWTKK